MGILIVLLSVIVVYILGFIIYWLYWENQYLKWLTEAEFGSEDFELYLEGLRTLRSEEVIGLYFKGWFFMLTKDVNDKILTNYVFRTKK